MVDFIRNELLLLLSYNKHEWDKKRFNKELLEQFEYDIKRKLEDVDREKEKLEYELKTLEYVKKEMGM